MSLLQREFLDKGYCIIKSNVTKLLPKIEKITNELNVIGKSIEPNFNLFETESVKSANTKKFYKAIRYTIGLYDLAISNELIKTSSELGCKIPVLNSSYVRVDIADEKEHAFDWHQDGPCIMGSMTNSISFWVPCIDVSKEVGSLEIIESSHSSGIIASKCERGEDPLTSGKLIIDEKDAPKGKRIILNLKKGEYLAFHPLLVHKSYYPNKSSITRVTATVRHDDISDKKHRENGFIQGSDNKNINSASQYRKLI